MTNNETEMNSSTSYMVKESRGLLLISKGANEPISQMAGSNHDLAHTINMDSIGTIAGRVSGMEVND